MKTTNIIIASVLLGVALTSSAASANSSCSCLSESCTTGTPVPIKVVSPTELPRRYINDSIKVTFVLDEQGVPHDVKPVGRMASDLAERLLPAVSQWRFSPSVVDGRPVSRRVILPLKLVDGDVLNVAVRDSDGHADVADRVAPPVPVKIVAPTQLPSRYANTTVRLSFTLDENGVPHDVRSVDAMSDELAARLLPVISEWRFTPSQVDGRAVKRRVILPLTLEQG